MVYKLTCSMHIVAHCVSSDLCSGMNQVLFNHQMVFILFIGMYRVVVLHIVFLLICVQV